MRRVRGQQPTPMFEDIGLRHAWIAGAVLLLVPVLVTCAMRPDAIGALFTGGNESASSQFEVVAVASVLGLLALSPWLSRLRMPALPDAGAHPMRILGVVVLCWLALFALGIIVAKLHHLAGSGDTSTLQTRTVEALVRSSWSDYGLAVTLLLIAGVVPILEEVVFRGLLLGGMARHISFGWANSWQALLFATVHADAPRFVVYLALGLFAGGLVRRYRALWPAIALHALNNGMATWMFTGT